ncbi:SpoIIE family protein phosphatase [Georgenia sp. AZ-5]|uniref:SpoIIE family protein phosphatase n=1 Tax=Georgenia sp. AZ-5 TaxID=3367526 RepID=UPI003754027E
MSLTERARAWAEAPCGLVNLDVHGLVVDANDTFLEWVGRAREDVVGRVRLSELLSAGGRIFWETHLAPMLHADHRVDEVAVELRSPGGRLPVLMTAVVRAEAEGTTVRVVLSSARERSRYERELLAARTAADRAAARTRTLQQVTAALSTGVGIRAVADALVSAAVGALGARAATLWTYDPRAGFVPHTASGEDLGTVPPPADAVEETVARVSGDRVVVPLHGQSGLQGVLSLAPRTDPGAEPVGLDVLTAVGQQAGTALDRAGWYEHSATVAHQLQQSLLAAEVPQDERFVVTTDYRPGVETLEVGGDWYDAFLVEDEVLAVVVGDVVGRGLAAASAMGQLRSAVRAVAGPGVGPARLLSRLDRFVQQVPAAASATLAYAEVELRTGSVRYACAGHLPPLLLPADGEARLVWDGRSTPLGLVLPGKDRTEAELRLGPGDRVLLYTDGLVERRDRPLVTGLQALADVAAGLRRLPPAEVVPTLTEHFLRDQQGHDDVCVLLLSWRGGPRPAEGHGKDAERSAV